MPIHLRQICLVAEKLKPAIDDLTSVLGLKVCHVDPEVGKWGLENALLPIGTDFLEVVAPVTQGTSAGRHLARRGGDGGYMVICQVPSRAEQEAVRARAADNAVRVAFEFDRENWRIMQLHPGHMRGAYLEVDWDEQADVVGNWMPAGGTDWKDSVATDLVTRIAGLELQGPDPVALAAHWGAVCGIEPAEEDGEPVVRLTNADLRFVVDSDGRGPGLGGMDIVAADRERLQETARSRGCVDTNGQINLCGTRINIVDGRA